MKKLALVVALALTACGTNPPPEAPSTKKPDGPQRPPAIVEPQQEVKATIETITIPHAWARKTMNAPISDVKTWAAVRENAMKIDSHLHTLITTGPDAKAKMDRLLARVAKKEDLLKLEKETRPKETELSREASERLVLSLAATLAPGEATKDPVKMDDGAYFWMKKDIASEDELTDSYRKVKGPELAKKVAEEISAKMKGDTSARAAIADAVTSVLGDNAAADVDRPQAVVVDDKRIKALRLPDDAKEKLAAFVKTAGPGQVLEPPIATPHVYVVARGVTPARDPQAR